MNLVVQFSMSCAFRYPCFRSAAYLLYHFVFPLSRGFLNFFQVFSLGSFGTLLSSCLPADFVCCSLTAPVVYHIIPPLSIPFQKFFQVFHFFFLVRLPSLPFTWFYPHFPCYLRIFLLIWFRCLSKSPVRKNSDRIY